MVATTAFGTSFVVPTDAELVAKSSAIMIGTVEGSYVQDRNDTIETVYEIRAERALKSEIARGDLVRIVSPGGVIGDRGVIVPGSAHFRQGERVLLFLTLENGVLRTTDLTLGKFRFAQSTTGERMLVRDMEDVLGWDHAGREHRENIRREAGFLRFIEERVSGRSTLGPPASDYQVQASAVTLQPSPSTESATPTTNAAFPAATYTDHVSGMPIRWANMAAGVTFWKRTDQNIAGAADGGVSVIQNGLAAWNNECGSNINLVYGGQRQTASAHHDGVNIVEFNDPQSRVSGSWTGSGTVGITFLSFAGDHEFDNRMWLSITDADVVFQNGYTASNAAFGASMTHELGHGIGWRHSNQNHLTGDACNPGVEECATAAIMNTSVNGNYGYTLQPWDINAARSVYPGGTCGSVCNAPSFSQQPASTTITAGSSATLSVSTLGTAPLSYQWYVGTSGNTSTPVAGATASWITVSPASTTSYWVRVTNSCGAANSNTATVTVNARCDLPSFTQQPASTTITAGGSASLSVSTAGTAPMSYQWYVGASGNTSTPISGATGSWVTVSPSATTSYWVRVSNTCGVTNSATATVTVNPRVATRRLRTDFDGDGMADLFWRNSSNAGTAIWFMNGLTTRSVGYPGIAELAWTPVAFGDMTGDGKSDIFWRHTNGSTGMWVMNGASYRWFSYTTMPSPWGVIASGDFNGDGTYDLLWRNSSTGDAHIWRMGNNTYTVLSLPNISTAWQATASGDFDGDGDFDLFWTHPASGSNVMWVMVPAGYSTVTMPAVTGWRVEAAGDFNGDGRHDLFWRSNTTSAANYVWRMNGSTYTSVALPPLSSDRSVAVVGDLDGNGTEDIVLRSTSGGLAAWLMSNGAVAGEYALPGVDPSWILYGK
jgi:hypothetical protein